MARRRVPQRVQRLAAKAKTPTQHDVVKLGPDFEEHAGLEAYVIDDSGVRLTVKVLGSGDELMVHPKDVTFVRRGTGRDYAAATRSYPPQRQSSIRAVKPAGVDEDDLEDMLEYLDALRESGVTNMYGAGAYLVSEFGIDRRLAKKVLVYWMKTYGE